MLRPPADHDGRTLVGLLDFQELCSSCVLCLGVMLLVRVEYYRQSFVPFSYFMLGGSGWKVKHSTRKGQDLWW